MNIHPNNPNAARLTPFHLYTAFVSGKRSLSSHIRAGSTASVSNIPFRGGSTYAGYLLTKRIIDVTAGLLALILLSFVILIISLLVKIDSPGNILFLQQRVGRNGKYFTIYKFRTLHVEHFGILTDREAPYDYSITRIGRYLRRYKLDEIPQFVNVLLGDMSIVGPRPDIPVQVDRYIAHQRNRLQVKPGLTGISQVSGNTMLTWPERIQLDIWYIQHRTCMLDLKIIGHTLITCIKGDTLDTDPFNVHRLLPGRKRCA